MKTDVESSIWLEDPRCWDAKLAGNKAASLARLATRHNVPVGFVIPNGSGHFLKGVTGTDANRD